jgi:transposase InsO family protein
MKASDVTDTLELALQASGCDQVNVRHRPRLLSDNGSSYISGDLAEWLEDRGMDHIRGAAYHPQTEGKIASQRLQANACRPAEKMASDPEEPYPSGKLLPPR